MSGEWPPVKPAGWDKLIMPNRTVLTSWSLPPVIQMTCEDHGLTYWLYIHTLQVYYCEILYCRQLAEARDITPDGVEAGWVVTGKVFEFVEDLRRSFINARHNVGSMAVAAAEMGQ